MLKIILFLSSYVLIAQSFEIIDLTHSFDHNGTTAYWKMNDAFQYTSSLKTQTADYYYETNSFCASEHGGTHLDAPVHFAKGKFGVDQIPLEQLVSAPYIVDVSENAKDDSDFQLEVKHLTNAEEKQGRIPDGSILLIDNGWSSKYKDLRQYFGGDPKNSSLYHFPGIHPDAAKWLVENRTISAVGIDTPSIDYGQSTKFETHVLLYTQNIPGFENVDLSEVSEIRKMKQPLIVALPMKIKGGSGAPLRIVAIEAPTRLSSSSVIKMNLTTIISLMLFLSATILWI